MDRKKVQQPSLKPEELTEFVFVSPELSLDVGEAEGLLLDGDGWLSTHAAVAGHVLATGLVSASHIESGPVTHDTVPSVPDIPSATPHDVALPGELFTLFNKMSQVCSKSMSTQMTVQPYRNNTSIGPMAEVAPKMTKVWFNKLQYFSEVLIASSYENTVTEATTYTPTDPSTSLLGLIGPLGYELSSRVCMQRHSYSTKCSFRTEYEKR